MENFKLNDFVFLQGGKDIYRIGATRHETLLGKGSNPFMKELYAKSPFDYIILKVSDVEVKDDEVLFDSKGSINVIKNQLSKVPANAINTFVNKFYSKYGDMMSKLAYE